MTPSRRPISRRGFFAATAASTVVAQVARAAVNDTIRVGIIGCRVRGPQVADSMIATGQFDIAAYCDCDREILDATIAKTSAAGQKARPVTDFRDLLDDSDIDAIVVATPDHWHATMTRLGLDAGKHVYVEKPASFNMGDGKAMMAATEAHPTLVVQVGTQQRSGRHFKDARAFIQEGGLGTVGLCRAWITHNRDFLDLLPDSEPPAHLNYDMWVGPAPMVPYNENKLHYNWHWSRHFGTGEMGNWGAHWIDVARWLGGLDLPRAAMGSGGQYVVHDAKEWPDTQTVIYEFASGATMLWELRLWTKFGVNDQSSGAEINGDKGSIVINRRGWTFYPKGEEAIVHEGSELDVAHAQSFADAIRDGAAPAATMEDGHKTALYCHLGNLATTVNRRLDFDPATEAIVGDAEASALSVRANRAPWNA